MEKTNSIGMKLVLIPLGEFEMGSRQEEIDHEITLDEIERIRILRVVCLSLLGLRRAMFAAMRGVSLKTSSLSIVIG